MSIAGMRNVEKVYLNKIKARIAEIDARFVRTEAVPVGDVCACETRAHLSIGEAMRLKYRPARHGFRWGRPWSTAWFRLRIKIPARFRGETVGLEFRPEGECLIYRDRKPIQGLGRERWECILLDKARGGESIELFIEAGSNASFDELNRRVMRLPRLFVMNRAAWEAFYDLSALFKMVDPDAIRATWLGWMCRALPEDDTRRARIVYALNRAVDAFDYASQSRAEISASANRARAILKPVYACRASASAQTIACFGHAHIDVAWLWRLAETVRKCGRTFANVLELMDHYPEFIFVQSQPHLYEFAKERYPSLYEKIRRRVKGGRWIPTGCMWVEPDCNTTGGESLVRQVLFGTRFFRREFGFKVEDLWLPDVFGYSAAMPQILRRSGIRYFLTQKISWSQFTKFPYHSFWWEGIDGSRVLAHFPPSENYQAKLEAAHMISAANAYREKDRSPIQAVPYGHGDGGGGPTRTMLELMRRYRNLEGMPKLEPMTPARFFGRLEKESSGLPRWVGELYLEMHRGTYTTQALSKKFNRQCELRLREAELLSAISGGAYDRAKINAMWKIVLLNQFHDILPGSSIDEVYADSHRQYAVVLAGASAMAAKALGRIAARAGVTGRGNRALVFNTLAWERRGVAAVPPAIKLKGNALAVAPDGSASPVQVGCDGVARFTARAPSMGYAVYSFRSGSSRAPSIAASARRMENECVRLDFDAQGRLRRIYDKTARRDALAPGAVGNQFVLFEDKPVSAGQAWEIDVYYADKPLATDGRFVSAKVVERGPVRSVVRFKRLIGKSVIIQDVVLSAGSRRIDFVTTVEWGDEKDVMLKVAFPLNVRSDRARYEIQFGSVERPTHRNRPQDLAMFEVPAQKWADLSEGDYGVALLNDCKYGYDARDNVLRLTLLRAPKYPGKSADVNRTHRFTYAILPHAGAFVNGVVRAGYELNVPLIAHAPGRAGKAAALKQDIFSAMEVSGDNVVIDTVKRAEDDAGVIVRLYEAHGCRGRRVFSTALPARRVFETDLMERVERELVVRNSSVELEFTPFKITTLKLLL